MNPPAASSSAPAWIARPYQRDVFAAYKRGIKRFQMPWHRRAGKDRTGMEFTRERMDEEIGAYWHLFPKLVQAKRAIWNGVDPASGKQFIDQTFPEPWRVHKNDQDLFLRSAKGSTWQLGGSDSYDRLVGSNVRGVVFSEWSLCNPMAWEYIRPILVENGGWAMFIYTFRGKNHAYQQWKKLQGNPDWYLDLRTIEQTTRDDAGTPVVTREAVDKEIRDGMSASLARQEFYCDPVAARPGAIYGVNMTNLLEGGRAARVGYDSTLPVIAAWNLEDMPANCSVVFFQRAGNEVNVIGSRSWMFTPLAQCIGELAKFPWRVAEHVLRIDTDSVWPDFFARQELPVSMAREHASVGKATAITAALLDRCYIDTAPRPWLGELEAENNELLIDSLNGYRLKELETVDGPENFVDVPLVTYERYLAGAVELFAAWEWARRARATSRAIDYSAQDRAVI